jgi:predicted O-methyltransferase YrrM
MESPEPCRLPWIYRRTRHPVFAWLGLRPIFAQHTSVEHEALKRWAGGRRRLVEIGVAEGASALALREAMSLDGTLYLIDPFHLSRIHWINATSHAAVSAVSRCQNGTVVWIRKFSSKAVDHWVTPIDLVFFDGDHSEQAVRQDWVEWHRFVVPGGVAIFHDARVFPGGWPTLADGPVKVVNSLFRDAEVWGWKIVEEVHSMVVVQREE